MKNFLAIDTSSPVLSIALKAGEKNVAESKSVGFLKHAENLLPMIDRLLKKNRLKLEQIDAFLINQGPGSFTGLRMGFATLKGFVAAKNRPCFGGLSLDMIAENIALPVKSRLAVCLDARRERLFVRFYERRKSGWEVKSKTRVVTLDEFIGLLSVGTYLTGDALFKYGTTLKKLSQEKQLTFLPEKTWYPKASTLIQSMKLQKSQKKRSSFLQDLRKPKDFLPLYFRLSEAEEKKRTYGAHC